VEGSRRLGEGGKKKSVGPSALQEGERKTGSLRPARKGGRKKRGGGCAYRVRKPRDWAAEKRGKGTGPSVLGEGGGGGKDESMSHLPCEEKEKTNFTNLEQ